MRAIQSSTNVVRVALLLLSSSLSGGLLSACADDGSDDPSGDAPDDTQTQADGGMMGTASAASADPGKGDGKDVIAIGDSWMSLNASEGIQFSLEKASGQDYRTYGVGGTRLLNEVIPMQYAAAKAENPDIKTVVMTAGGNDILQDFAVLPSCGDSRFDGDPPTCRNRIDEVAARLVKFWAQMSADGVRDVIIISYSAKASILGPLAKSVAYSNTKIQPLCEAVPAPLRCHSFDSDMSVPDLALRDGIHPNAAGYEALGVALTKFMADKGVRR